MFVGLNCRFHFFEKEAKTKTYVRTNQQPDYSVPMYSGIFSEKAYVNRKLVKKNFFASPMSMDSKIILQPSSHSITVTYPNRNNDTGNKKYILEGLKKNELGLFKDVISFTDDAASMTVLLNHEDFQIVYAKKYGNKDFISIRIMITPKGDKNKFLMITFDFSVHNTKEEQRNKVHDYLNGYVKEDEDEEETDDEDH